MKKRALTLIELMIVIVLIGLIGGVVAYNMRGSLDKGRAFKTEQGGVQVYNLLMLAVAEGNSIEKVVSDWEQFIANSGMVKNAEQTCRDGWGQLYTVRLSDKGDDIVVSSTHRGYENKNFS
ncbi:MAG: type II secretion system protein [Verrucomicrobia bacterium]|nr:type II secretion system protein [Verrucomicrobiota bacterium]